MNPTEREQMNPTPDTLENRLAIQRARIENAKQALAVAEAELAAAEDGETKMLWESRVAGRRRELEADEQMLAELEQDLKKSA